MMNRQKCWETVSQAIPLHTLSESIDVPYDIVLGVNLYNELEKLNFAPKCVEYLKKRSKSKDKLQNDLLFYDIFCGPNMSDYLTVSVFEVKLESLNVWVRYDFESYIMVAAILIIKNNSPPELHWVEKWTSIALFKTNFPTLGKEPDIIRLCIFANILFNVLKYCHPVKNFKRLLNICVCLAEGPNHTRIITGSSQCSYTEARVKTLNLVTSRLPYVRKSTAETSKGGVRGRAKAMFVNENPETNIGNCIDGDFEAEIGGEIAVDIIKSINQNKSNSSKLQILRDMKRSNNSRDGCYTNSDSVVHSKLGGTCNTNALDSVVGASPANYRGVNTPPGKASLKLHGIIPVQPKEKLKDWFNCKQNLSQNAHLVGDPVMSECDVDLDLGLGLDNEVSMLDISNHKPSFFHYGRALICNNISNGCCDTTASTTNSIGNTVLLPVVTTPTGTPTTTGCSNAVENIKLRRLHTRLTNTDAEESSVSANWKPSRSKRNTLNIDFTLQDEIALAEDLNANARTIRNRREFWYSKPSVYDHFVAVNTFNNSNNDENPDLGVYESDNMYLITLSDASFQCVDVASCTNTSVGDGIIENDVDANECTAATATSLSHRIQQALSTTLSSNEITDVGMGLRHAYSNGSINFNTVFSNTYSSADSTCCNSFVKHDSSFCTGSSGNVKECLDKLFSSNVVDSIMNCKTGNNTNISSHVATNVKLLEIQLGFNNYGKKICICVEK